jgi:hypothetical protein
MLAMGCGGMEGDPTEIVAVSSVKCTTEALEVIASGRENRFGLNGQQVALDPAIPIDRICNSLSGSCRNTCESAKAQAQSTGIKGFQNNDPVLLHQMGALADQFNAAMGLITEFRALGAVSFNQPGVVAECGAKTLQVIVKGKEHRFGFDNNQVALNPAIPINDICSSNNGLGPGCVMVCQAAGANALKTGGFGFSGNDDPVKLRQMGVLADLFNSAMGHPSNFTNAPIVQ